MADLDFNHLEISVIQQDIDLGIRNDGYDCMVALSIRRLIPGAKSTWVTANRIAFSVGEKRYVYLPPPPVAGYIVDFDAGRKIKPFSYVLTDSAIGDVSHRLKTVAKQEFKSVYKKPTYRASRAYGQRLLAVNQAKAKASAS
jgi:hypothetical protein